jgi:hypothetical protein
MSNSAKSWLIVVKNISPKLTTASSKYHRITKLQFYQKQILEISYKNIYHYLCGVRRALGQTQQHHPSDNGKFTV